MKRTIGTALLSVVLTLGVLSLMGQGRDDWRYGGRINGKMSVRDSLTVEGIATLRGRVVGSSSDFAKIDSFTTTALLDTTVMTGAAAGDVIVVTSYTPLWSATPDTNMFYSAYVLNTDSVVVKREKAAAANDAKSGGQYMLIRIEK